MKTKMRDCKAIIAVIYKTIFLNYKYSVELIHIYIINPVTVRKRFG